MSDTAAVLADFRRYGQLLRQMIRIPERLAFDLESATAVQVERGSVFPSVLVDPSAPMTGVERLIELASSDRLPAMAVIDRQGHHRPVYRPLLVYSWLQVFRIVYETLPRSEFGRWEEGLRPWCDVLEAELGRMDWSAGAMPAVLGGSATEMAWTALALQVAGKVYVRDAWIDLASDMFGKLTRSQRPDGSFLESSGSDNPEARWYHELVLLHAASSYAVQTEDRTVASAVARATRFHLEQTQPDHATCQPWGLFALVWNSVSRPVADQMLHATQMNHPDGLDGVSLMLLADALYCLELFA